MTTIERIDPPGLFKGAVPLSLVTRVDRFVFVSGCPGFDASGIVRASDFPSQMWQAMTNVARLLAWCGTDFSRAVKVNVLLTRREDVPEMNRIYATFFPEGRYPARTTTIVAGLPHPSFLVELDCQAVLESPCSRRSNATSFRAGVRKPG